MIAGCVCSKTDKSVPSEKQQLYRGGEKKLGDVFAADDSYMMRERDKRIKTVHQIIIKQHHTRGRGGPADGRVAAVMIFSRAAGPPV